MEGEEEVHEADGAPRKRKRLGGEAEQEAEGEGAGVYGKALLGDDGEDARYEGIAEEAVAEVMRWLEAEIVADNAAAPVPEAEGFVTINGNEESCGPSFSAAASTVMASVDTRAGAPTPPPVPWPWPWPEPEPQPVFPAPAAVGAEMETGEPADEEWLARLLTCGALLEGVL